MTAAEDGPPAYAVRLSVPVGDFIVLEYERMAEVAGLAVAEQWRHGLAAAIRGPAILPERCAVAPEDSIFQWAVPGQTLRQLVYRRTRTGPTWRILFSVHEADDHDPLTIHVRHIRHGAQAPLAEWPAEEQ